jgi:rod shape determining protein RodA
MRPRGSSMKHMDWTTFSIYIGLISVGLLMVYTVDYDEAAFAGNFFRTSAGKQAIWMVISILAFFLITLIEWKFWQTFSYLIYGVSVFLLVAVLLFGTNIKGATSWFTFGSFSFQPAEIAKFGTSLALANFLSTYSSDLRDLRTQFISFAIFLVPMGLILLQPDAGSALVFFSFTIMLYREGLTPLYFIVGAFVAGMLLLGFVFDVQFIALGLIWGFTFILSLNLKSQKWWWALGTLAFFAAGILFIREDLFRLVLLASIAVFLTASLVIWRQKKGKAGFYAQYGRHCRNRYFLFSQLCIL